MTLKVHWALRTAAVAVLMLALFWRFGFAPAPERDEAGHAPLKIAMMRPAQAPDAQVPAIFPPRNEASTNGEATPGGLTLLGVAGRIPDDVQVILRLPDGRTATLSPGGSIDDWTLLSVGADRAVLSNNGEQVILTIGR